MNDQQRIETAADNCEVLRARLARYEDADGKPITTIAEQAREIERLNYRYQREVYGLNNEGDPIGGDPAGGYANDNARLRKELAALKAQPSGVVLPAKYQDDTAYGQGRDDAIDEVARLNSSPASADDGMCNADNPGARCVCREEFGYRVCVKSGAADERAAFERVICERYGYTPQTVYSRWNGSGYDDSSLCMAWVVWQQARAALSAPSHGEQVREGFLLARETVLELPGGSKELGYTPMPGLGVFVSNDEVFAAIRDLGLPLGWVSVRLGQVTAAASPSAGGQEQGE